MYQATGLHHKLACTHAEIMARHACQWCHWQNFVYHEGTQLYIVAKAPQKGPIGQYF